MMLPEQGREGVVVLCRQCWERDSMSGLLVCSDCWDANQRAAGYLIGADEGKAVRRGESRKAREEEEVSDSVR